MVSPTLATHKNEVKEILAEDERKQFVRRYVARLMKRRRRSKDPILAELNEAIDDVLTNTKQGRLHIIAEANFQWQKLQLRKFLKTKGEFSYQDMKDFIHAHGWDAQWIPTKRLQGYWRSMFRTGGP